MKRAPKKKASVAPNLSSFSKLKQALIGLGVFGLIGFLADVLGLVSFFGKEDPKTVNQTTISNPNNSTVINDNSVNSTTINNNTTNFIDKSTYNCQVTNQAISTSASNPESKNDAREDIVKAANYFCNDDNDLAFDYINRHDLPPPGVNPVAFYTLKGNILFFKRDYDLSYQYLLKAFYLDKNSPYLDLSKLRGLTCAYGYITGSGYTMKDLKNIEYTNNGRDVIYDLGSKKIESIHGLIVVKKDDKELFELMRELKMPTSL